METKKVLGISGSPRKGNTEILVKRALEGASHVGGVETEYVSLMGKEIHFCQACDNCPPPGALCIFADDAAPILEKMAAADGIIIGTPVYMNNVSAQVKALMDRTNPFFASSPMKLRGKAGAVIAVGQLLAGGAELAVSALVHFYLSHQMMVIGGDQQDNFAGVKGFTTYDTSRDVVAKNERLLKDAEDLGEKMAKFLTGKLV